MRPLRSRRPLVALGFALIPVLGCDAIEGMSGGKGPGISADDITVTYAEVDDKKGRIVRASAKIGAGNRASISVPGPLIGSKVVYLKCTAGDDGLCTFDVPNSSFHRNGNVADTPPAGPHKWEITVYGEPAGPETNVKKAFEYMRPPTCWTEDKRRRCSSIRFHPTIMDAKLAFSVRSAMDVTVAYEGKDYAIKADTPTALPIDPTKLPIDRLTANLGKKGQSGEPYVFDATLKSESGESPIKLELAPITLMGLLYGSVSKNGKGIKLPPAAKPTIVWYPFQKVAQRRLGGLVGEGTTVADITKVVRALKADVRTINCGKYVDSATGVKVEVKGEMRDAVIDVFDIRTAKKVGHQEVKASKANCPGPTADRTTYTTGVGSMAVARAVEKLQP